jgi:RHH-type transcriptional regulator, proline utilization regulon repressor / proline dehydrogenase / delta 1-pyrroline-5-carboxylate dehydrogenase
MQSTPIIFLKTFQPSKNAIRKQMQKAYRMDEETRVLALIELLDLNPNLSLKISNLATDLINQVRSQPTKKSGMESFMMHYDLSTDEGIMLMCIAESLLRIPDSETENLLIRDKLVSAHWETHIGKSESTFVNLATRGLVLTGKVLKPIKSGYFRELWHNLIRKVGEPIIRQAVREAIKVMSEQFVIGRTMKEALKRSEPYQNKGYSFSYDMLGESAKTRLDG